MALDHLNYVPWSGVGTAQVWNRAAAGGAQGGGYDFGETFSLKLKRKESPVEMKTSRTTDRGTAFRMATGNDLQIEMQVNTITPFLQSLMNGGKWTESAAPGVVTGWVMPTGIEVGMVVRLPNRNVPNVVVTDSSGTPKTLPAAQYELDMLGGTVRFRDITTGGPYVQPFKASYTPGAVKVLGGLTDAPNKEFVMQFNGTNSYNAKQRMLVCHRIRFAVDGDEDFIQENSFGKYTVSASVLRDDTLLATSPTGQYYSIYE